MADFEKNIKKALEGIKPENFKPKSLSKKEKDLMRRIQEIGEGILKKEMGGEVMDMTKSQPVSMMDEGGQAISDADEDKLRKLLDSVKNKKSKKQTDEGATPFIMPGQRKLMNRVLGKGKPMEAAMGGPVKKMNMGGVVPGRGGSFKGVK